jgi:hypothetical protein
MRRMADHVEELRRSVRLDWPAEVALLVGTLTAEEWDCLADLLRTRHEEPISREAVRRCLDWPAEERR